jgi:hypothetical protein
LGTPAKQQGDGPAGKGAGEATARPIALGEPAGERVKAMIVHKPPHEPDVGVRGKAHG